MTSAIVIREQLELESQFSGVTKFWKSLRNKTRVEILKRIFIIRYEIIRVSLIVKNIS